MPAPTTPFATALLLASGVAFAQNPTNAGELQIEPEVSAVGSILTAEENTPTLEEGPAAPISDREVLPAGAAVDAASTRRADEQDLNVTTPRIPLGRTRAADFTDDIDEGVPTGAHGNGYRPASATGFYDNALEEDRRQRGDYLAPTVQTPPQPIDPIRPALPPSVYNLPGDNSIPAENPAVRQNVDGVRVPE